MDFFSFFQSKKRQSRGSAAGREDEGLRFRRAERTDDEAALSLFREAWTELKRQRVMGQNEADPTAETVNHYIAAGQLFLGFYGERLIAAYVLNRSCDEGAGEGLWQYPRAEYGVVHWLCVRPSYQGIKMGRRTMRHIEKQARQLGMETLRLTVSVFNSHAVALCQHLHYQKVGIANLRTGQVYFMEKKI